MPEPSLCRQGITLGTACLACPARALHNGALLWGDVCFSNLCCAREPSSLLPLVKCNCLSFCPSCPLTFFPASQDICLVPARVGRTGSISLPGETHEGIEEGSKGGGLGITGGHTACLCNPDPFWCQSFLMERDRGVRGWVKMSLP